MDIDENECGAYELCAAARRAFPALVTFGLRMACHWTRQLPKMLSVSAPTRARGAADAAGAKGLMPQDGGVPTAIQAETALFCDSASDVVRPSRNQ